MAIFKKRALPLLLAVMMVCTLLPVNTFATADETTTTAETIDETIIDESVIAEDPVINPVASIGTTGYETLDAAFAAAQDGNEVKILVAGTYALSTSGKNLIITGAVNG